MANQNVPASSNARCVAPLAGKTSPPEQTETPSCNSVKNPREGRLNLPRNAAITRSPFRATLRKPVAALAQLVEHIIRN
ncbi:hypothetical protein [Pseudaminobacter salicylatoxidans]|uniref:hypothetical protein n=1 Tax=Pseudaminobacter salicylatoxidans TaxID=93369 RepID=UPI0011B228A6|nr:hypothetical protein [Pseudaminobacter salicylatoxidans]